MLCCILDGSWSPLRTLALASCCIAVCCVVVQIEAKSPSRTLAVVFYCIAVCCVVVWWKADHLWEPQASTTAAGATASPQAGVRQPGRHGNGVSAALQRPPDGPPVWGLLSVLPGQGPERSQRIRAGHLEVPQGGKTGHPWLCAGYPLMGLLCSSLCLIFFIIPNVEILRLAYEESIR